MVTETAYLKVKLEQSNEFEKAVKDVASLFSRAQGCSGMALDVQVEDPSCYVLMVDWQSVEDHTVGFRGSSAFDKWRAAVSQYLIEPPEAFHFRRVATFF